MPLTITPEIAKAAGNESDLAALECSKKHWEEIEECLRKGESYITGLPCRYYSTHCACCYRTNADKFASRCPLSQNNSCCNGLWSKFSYDQTVENAHAIVLYIDEAIKKR